MFARYDRSADVADLREELPLLVDFRLTGRYGVQNYPFGASGLLDLTIVGATQRIGRTGCHRAEAPFR